MAEIIAEIGINHQGKPEMAKSLIFQAFQSGISRVKFQYRNDVRGLPAGKEIGDEILNAELKKNHMSVNHLQDLVDYSKQLGLETGISFFSLEDLRDWKDLSLFDFYKIPSVVMQDRDLIIHLLEFGKDVYISTGAQLESTINSVFSSLETFPNWIPLHCISNYPTATHNAALGYITKLKERWGRVGFSSHDSNWAICVLALTLGAEVIERHITLDKNLPGLDHSSSSTPDELRLLSDICKNFEIIMRPVVKRKPNQGEKINLQNLGRSFYALRPYRVGEQITLSDLDYRSPQIGLNALEIRDFMDRPLTRDLEPGEVLSVSHYSKTFEFEPLQIQNAVRANISIPVRPHDFARIRSIIPIRNFEFHLTYGDIDKLTEDFLQQIGSEEVYSVHLPDYLNSSNLTDFFSHDPHVRMESDNLLQASLLFAKRLALITHTTVPLVASFSNIANHPNFIDKVEEIVKSNSSDNVVLLPQILPPFAWYFGGSIPIHSLNSLHDFVEMNKRNIPVCLDVSHLLMVSNYENIPLSEYLELLNSLSRHFHISGASGIDGEGTSVKDIEEATRDMLNFIWFSDKQKVLEVWQGHMNNYSGFCEEILNCLEWINSL